MLGIDGEDSKTGGKKMKNEKETKILNTVKKAVGGNSFGPIQPLEWPPKCPFFIYQPKRPEKRDK